MDKQNPGQNRGKGKRGRYPLILEHAIPERMFYHIDSGLSGISAVKALNIASSEGQKLYIINSSNKDEVLPHINHDAATLQDIEFAVKSGKDVLTHTSIVTVPGYTGYGYIIIDPNTGDGAYKISGGQNGGLLFLIAGLVAIAVMMFFVALVFVSGPFSVVGFALFGVGELFLFEQLLDFNLLLMKASKPGCEEEGLDIIKKGTYVLVIEAILTRGFAKSIIGKNNVFKEAYYEMMEVTTVGGGFGIVGEINNELNDPDYTCN